MTATPASTSRWQPLILAILGLAAPAAVWTASAQVTADPWQRVALAVASFLVVLVAGFVSKVWEKLNSRWVDACANWVDHKIRMLFSSYRKRYLRYLGYKHRSFDVKGLSTQGAHSIEIEQVFVELSVDPRSPTGIKSDPITSSTGERHTIWDYLELSRVEGSNLAVIGAPGCGKTTLLKHLALMLAARRERRFRAFTPFLLFLRDHAKAIQDDAQVTLTLVIASALTSADLKPPDGWLENELDRGRGLILLDGLDEVADPDLRRLVVEWVERQMTRYGNDRFIVTSRPFGYRSNPLSGVTVLQVLSFTWPQVELFVSNWYLATETVAAGKKDPGVDMAARDGAADLMRRLRGNPALSDLAVNPLLLTMIATVHRYRSTLPGRRVELYYEIFEVFLGKRQQARGISLDFTPEQKKRVLEPLAWAMMTRNNREISREEAALAIEEALSRITSSSSPEGFLRNIEESSGLLLERENGIYAFAHLTFQEYLAASHARERGLQSELTEHTHEEWWQETLRLFAAQSDATSIVVACLDNARSAMALALALECGEEARELQSAVRLRLDLVLTDEIESRDSERRRIIAEALLARRLRSLVRLDDSRYIDDTLITNAEYQLFLDEFRTVDRFYQPDHWTSLTYTPGSAKEPVVGVRPSDSEMFCKWLSEHYGHGWNFRIPEDIDVEGDDLGSLQGGFWARSVGGSSSIRGGEGLVHPDKQLQYVRDLFRDDLRFADRVVKHLTGEALSGPPFHLSIGRSLSLDGVSDLIHRDLYGSLARELSGQPGRNKASELLSDLHRRLALILDRSLPLNDPTNVTHVFKRFNDLSRRQLVNNKIRARRLALTFCLIFKSVKVRSSPFPLLFSSVQPDTSEGYGALADRFWDLYQKLCLLKLRIEGKIAPCEGVRIVKFREQQTIADGK